MKNNNVSKIFKGKKYKYIPSVNIPAVHLYEKYMCVSLIENICKEFPDARIEQGTDSEEKYFRIILYGNIPD